MRYLPLALLFLATAATAIVNPDAPDYVGAFHQRMVAYQDRIGQGRTTVAMDQASVAMAKALDKELNAAYQKLMTRLSSPQKSALRASQRQWLKYRDAEYAFLADTFTRAAHGSSAVLTVGSARNALVYERAEELWSYLEQL